MSVCSLRSESHGIEISELNCSQLQLGKGAAVSQRISWWAVLQVGGRREGAQACVNVYKWKERENMLADNIVSGEHITAM